MSTTGRHGRPRTRAPLTAFALGLVLVVGVTTQAAAQTASRIPFSGVFYGCAGTDGAVWVSGNVLHIRGFTNRNLWVTGNPLIDGYEENVGNGNINLATGEGIGHPKVTLMPDAVDGTWEMQVTVDISPTGLTAHGTGRGTGQLLGMTLEFTSPGGVPLGPGENPCSDLPFAALVQGEILVPPSVE